MIYTAAAADDPEFIGLASQLLHRYDQQAHEDNIRSAIRDFVVGTGLCEYYEVVSEAAPQMLPRKRADLKLPGVFMEVKTRIGTAARAGEPASDHISQLDTYVDNDPMVGIGVLSDGKRWLLRSPGSRRSSTPHEKPWMFVLDKPENGVELYRWLSRHVFNAETARPLAAETIADEFGSRSFVYQDHIATLYGLYESRCGDPSVQVKRQLWETLLKTALGEIEPEDGLDGLFVRHTYLTALIAMIAQAVYDTELTGTANRDPGDLLYGRNFQQMTGISGVVESDFFSWPSEIPEGHEILREIAARVDSYDWSRTPAGLASSLYEAIIPPTERKRLGEYYTPMWLAEAIVKEAVTDPLKQRVLDPACGSGRFIVAAVKRVLEAAEVEGLNAEDTFEVLLENVKGIDIHPVAVHLARIEWVLTARSIIKQARRPVSPPVYLGDSLQLLTDTSGMFAGQTVTVRVHEDSANRELRFPRSLVQRTDTFDRFMAQVVDEVRNDNDPFVALQDHDIPESENSDLRHTMTVIQQLHSEGRNHIWGYYCRNLIRPIAIAEHNVDVIVGNPPWLTYNKTVAQLRQQLRNLAKNKYDIWDGGRYATHADLAGLFFTRCVDLYLANSGVCAMVLPHSALAAGQYAKWRTGKWSIPDPQAVQFRVRADLAHCAPWNLEPLNPNDFFPVPACVVFAKRANQKNPLPQSVESWYGEPGGPTRKTTETIPHSDASQSHYGPVARQGATIVPRCLFFVESPTEARRRPHQAPNTSDMIPRRTTQEKNPWKGLDLDHLDKTIPDDHLFKIAAGETIAPFVVLQPLRAVLPISLKRRTLMLGNGEGGIDRASLKRNLRNRWAEMSRLYDANKGRTDNKNLIERLDYHKELTSQLEWHKHGDSSLRVLYTSSGHPTAVTCEDRDMLVDYTLYWMPVDTHEEADYLCGIINSRTLRERVKPLMPIGQFGSRHLQKHLWKLNIPEYDANHPKHGKVVEASRTAAAAVRQAVNSMNNPTSRTARRVARDKLTEAEGQTLDNTVKALLDNT